MKVQSGADTRNRMLGTVISTNCNEILPLPPQIHTVYIHGRSSDGSVRRKGHMQDETTSEPTLGGR